MSSRAAAWVAHLPPRVPGAALPGSTPRIGHSSSLTRAPAPGRFPLGSHLGKDRRPTMIGPIQVPWSYFLFGFLVAALVGLTGVAANR